MCDICATFVMQLSKIGQEKGKCEEMKSRIASVSVFVLILVFVLALWTSAAAAPAMTIQPSRYARLGSLTAAEAASLGNIARAAAQPMTVSAANPATWVKPEGIKASGAANSATSQSPWIKPEGIKPFGAK
jgi:hypothetical protein